MSSAAARKLSSASRTPASHVATSTSVGTAAPRCCRIWDPRTAPPSTEHRSRTGSWQTATSFVQVTRRFWFAFSELRNGRQDFSDNNRTFGGPSARRRHAAVSIVIFGGPRAPYDAASRQCSNPAAAGGSSHRRRWTAVQGLILQLTRAGFLLLLWLFVWAVLRTLRSDIYAGSGGQGSAAVHPRRKGPALTGQGEGASVSGGHAAPSPVPASPWVLSRS